MVACSNTSNTNKVNEDVKEEINTETTKKVGNEIAGYINVPNDFVEFKDINGYVYENTIQYSSLNEFDIITLYKVTDDSFAKYAVESNALVTEVFGASLAGVIEETTGLKLQFGHVKDDDYIINGRYIEGTPESNDNMGKYLTAFIFSSRHEENSVYVLVIEGSKDEVDKLKMPIFDSWTIE